MAENHASSDDHINLRFRTRLIFALIFIPAVIFLMKPFIARQLLYRGASYAGSGLLQESIKHYKRGLFIDSGNAEGWNNLADVYKSVGDVDKAVKAYEKAIKADPRNKKALYSLGMIFGIHKDQYEKAMEYFDQVRKLGPESEAERSKYVISYHILALRALATGYERSNDIDKAVSVLEELLRHYPNSKDAEAKLKKLSGLIGK
jgi:cytochrome c-type biogenesis protein CcmH/NrfG